MLHSHPLTVLPEWIDHNGHMNVAFYVLAFDQITDQVYEDWGIGLDYADQGQSLFTLGMNVDYLAELMVDESICVTTRLLDVDHKRLHYYHQMFRSADQALVATNECLAINVNLASRRSARFPTAVQQQLARVHRQHSALPMPDGVSRKLGIRRLAAKGTPQPNTI